MTNPARVGELLPGILQEVVERAGAGYKRWMELVAQAGYCHHPIRFAGRVEHADRQTGEVRTVYDTGREPDGVLLKACGTRRESRCPSCAATYRADAYQLLAAGLKGGKGVPETVAIHPRLFVTFTAPSFGRVHSRKAQGRLVLPCHPHRQGARCPHGVRAGCWHRHDENDSRLGEPLCPACYDAQAQVLWNGLAPELWRRTTIALHRALGGWPASRSGSCAGWCGSPMPRWPSSNDAGRSTSTPSCAWMRPPSAAVLAAWPHHPRASRRPFSRRPCGWRSRPSGCPDHPWRRAGRSGMPAGGGQLDARNITRDEMTSCASAWTPCTPWDSRPFPPRRWWRCRRPRARPLAAPARPTADQAKKKARRNSGPDLW
jgi:Replication initiator protein, pSAM2